MTRPMSSSIQDNEHIEALAEAESESERGWVMRHTGRNIMRKGSNATARASFVAQSVSVETAVDRQTATELN